MYITYGTPKISFIEPDETAKWMRNKDGKKKN